VKRYACVPVASLERGRFTIMAVQPEHIEAIRQWRNAQLDVLRQPEPISPEQQVDYYEHNIWPTMDAERPANILVSLLEDGVHVAYGGLVHIDWDGNRAEVSFLADPAHTQDPTTYRHYHSNFLELVKELAFDHLGFDALTTETYAHRPAHIANLEVAGFRREQTIANAVVIDGVPTDSIMHRCPRSTDPEEAE
jgi:RimJ/RimL family protein N-acetyltransferase